MTAGTTCAKSEVCLSRAAVSRCWNTTPDTDVPGPPRQYRLAESQVIEELDAAGLVLLERFDFLPREYFLVFGLTPRLE